MKKRILDFVNKKFSFWKSAIITIIVIAIVGVGGRSIYNRLFGQTQNNSSIYVNIKKLEEVHDLVLLDIGVQKIKRQENNTKLFGSKIVIPGSEKKAIIIVNYTAKLGIKRDVSIKDEGEHEYRVVLPKYEVIGVSLDKEKPYELYDKKSGILSYSTKDIDTGEAMAEVTSDGAQEEFLKSHKETLDRSAKRYYTSLIKSIDKEASVTVESQND